MLAVCLSEKRGERHDGTQPESFRPSTVATRGCRTRDAWVEPSRSADSRSSARPRGLQRRRRRQLPIFDETMVCDSEKDAIVKGEIRTCSG